MDKWEKLLVDMYAEISKITGILTGGNGSGLIQQVQNHDLKIDELEKTTVKKNEMQDSNKNKQWAIGVAISTIIALAALLVSVFYKK